MRAWGLVLGVGLALGADAAAAKTVKGPSLSVEEAQPGRIRPEEGAAPETEVRRRRYEAMLLAPIPVNVFGGMFVFRGDFFKEQREYSGNDAPAEMATDLKNPNVAGLGTVFLPHMQEGAPKLLFIASRYGRLSFEDDARPMAELIVGADIADDDMPFPVKLAPTDDGETRIMLRYRRFPGFERWLPIVGHKFLRASGWSVDVLLPNYALVGWQTKDEQWKIYGGGRLIGREYPFEDGEVRGWMEGHGTNVLLGLRIGLVKPLFLALEGGISRETLTYYREDGQKLARHKTDFAPWARVALETWVKLP